MSRFKKAALSCLIVLILLTVPTVTTFAVTDNIYTLSSSRPTVTESSGFIEVLLKSANGNYYVNVFGWNVFTANADTKTHVDLRFENSRLYLDIYEWDNNSPTGAIALYHIGSNKTLYYYENATIEHYFTIPDTIVNFNVYGNYGEINVNKTDSTMGFAVEYTNESPILIRLDEIIAILTNNSDIIQNQDKNTQEIIDNQNQLQENEKIEAGSTGNSSSDQLTSVIPNDSEGFTNSLNSLLGAMSTTATDCNIKIPELKLPNIAGITPEAVLLEQQYFDLGSMFNIIPIQIMTLLRSLLDIALVVFCFKELYSTIEYVLTLRKGGD